MSVTLSTSPRTMIRDAIMAALTARKGTDAMRLQSFEVRDEYIEASEIKQGVTYCVIVTDESLTSQTMQGVDCHMTVLLVIYIKDTGDVRAKLDQAIEDTYETVLSVQSANRSKVWKLKLEGLTTDEGTTLARPHAQAVQRWEAHCLRDAVGV